MKKEAIPLATLISTLNSRKPRMTSGEPRLAERLERIAMSVVASGAVPKVAA